MTTEDEHILKGKEFLFLQNYEEAFRQFSKYGTEIHTKSNYYLALMYKEGQFVEKNDQAAMALFWLGCILISKKQQRGENIEIENFKCAFELFKMFRHYRYKKMLEFGIQFILKKKRKIQRDSNDRIKINKISELIFKGEGKSWFHFLGGINPTPVEHFESWCLSRCGDFWESRYEASLIIVKKEQYNSYATYIIQGYEKGYETVKKHIENINETYKKQIDEYKRIREKKNHHLSGKLINMSINEYNQKIKKLEGNIKVQNNLLEKIGKLTYLYDIE